MSAARFFYSLLFYLALPYVLLRLLWRSHRQRGYLEHVGERFGHYAHEAKGRFIWVHAVSVGETRAAAPLIRALLEKLPGSRVLLTHMTPTGRATGESLFGDRVTRCYLPYDYPGAVARFVRHFRPQVGIFMETEIWPNLIQACRAENVPLYLVNARLSEKSAAGYRHVRRLASESLAGFSAIAAQGEDDARRLAELGAERVRVIGNVKFDVTPPQAQLDLGRNWRHRFGERRPVLLAASTREGEETLLLDVLGRIEVPGLLLVIVPRHPQRFEEVAGLLASKGVVFQRRSKDETIADATRVVLGDSMGELFAYYAACDVAFIGGSLLPFGAQNLIEACTLGRPVLIGPSTYNFEEAAAQALQAGAAIQVADVESLAREATRLLGDPTRVEQMGRAGLEFCAAHRGATARVLQLIELPGGVNR